MEFGQDYVINLLLKVGEYKILGIVLFLPYVYDRKDRKVKWPRINYYYAFSWLLPFKFKIPMGPCNNQVRKFVKGDKNA